VGGCGRVNYSDIIVVFDSQTDRVPLRSRRSWSRPRAAAVRLDGFGCVRIPRIRRSRVSTRPSPALSRDRTRDRGRCRRRVQRPLVSEHARDRRAPPTLRKPLRPFDGCSGDRPVRGRQATAAFHGAYYLMTQVVVAPTVGGVASIEGLPGKLVGVQAMTLSDQLPTSVAGTARSI